jgi:pimeloyl-ACP methyl ester carboxylesterase
MRRWWLAGLIWFLLLGSWCWGQSLASERVLEVDGLQIHYSVEGQGEPVVLIHGFVANRQIQWAIPGITGALAKDYQVIAVDNRGHGRSSKPHDPQKYGLEMVHDVARILDQLNLPKAHLVGYSMGGLITAKFAMTYPQRVLTATVGGIGWLKPDTPTRLDELAIALEKEQSLEPLLVSLTPPGAPPPTKQQIQQLNAMMLSLGNDPKALAAVARGMRHFSIREEEFKQCRVPMQFIVGTKDPLNVGLQEAKALRPDLRVVLLEGANHMDAFQKPEFLQRVREFLAGAR